MVEYEEGPAGPGGGELPAPRSPFSTGSARRRVTPTAALMVAGGLVLGVGTGWLVNGGSGGTSPPPATRLAQPQQSQQPSQSQQPPRPTPVVTPTPAASPTPTVPADFAVVRDASEVTLAVPAGWRRTEGASVYYRSGDAPYSRFLQFWPLAERDISVTRALRITVATHRNLPGFELEALHPTGRGAAELRYSYDSTRTGKRLTLLQRVFTAGDGQRYAFAVVGPASEWPWQRTTLTAVLAPFEAGADPTGAEISTGPTETGGSPPGDE
ncbi:hypothetical protein [Streptomyces sp. NPDC051561]|uniref:hypothetical protein n=1 Tax=Streptomyces sp. NPDC051561 TaxID=3365658 RepID=UPI003791FA63